MSEIVYKKPVQLYAEEHYTQEELAFFIKSANFSLSSSDPEDPKRIVVKPSQLYTLLRTSFDDWWREHMDGKGRVNTKHYHARLFYFMYCVPFDKVPLYVNEDNQILPVVLWRLKISK